MSHNGKNKTAVPGVSRSRLALRSHGWEAGQPPLQAPRSWVANLRGTWGLSLPTHPQTVLGSKGSDEDAFRAGFSRNLLRAST